MNARTDSRIPVIDSPSGGLPLGKASEYRDRYTPTLLFPIARQNKRDEIGICASALPFTGVDVWNAYELSWLTSKGKPVVALGEFVVPADSPNLIESKSLKLYLNSLNQTVFADLRSVEQTLIEDLSAAAGAPVMVKMADLRDRPSLPFQYPQGILLDNLDIACDAYTPAPELLTVTDGADTEETLISHLLKSNCLVTGQPDWAMVMIRYRGRPIDHAGLLRYIVSFRQHNEFHEQCVERMYCDLLQRCAPTALSVYARYTRRGGLDINPFRTTGEFMLPVNVRDIRQ